jgi:hypothetical protein
MELQAYLGLRYMRGVNGLHGDIKVMNKYLLEIHFV